MKEKAAERRVAWRLGEELQRRAAFSTRPPKKQALEQQGGHAAGLRRLAEEGQQERLRGKQ